MSTPNSKTQVALLIMSALLEAIHAAGDQGAPSGVLYAGVMTFGMNIHQYQSIIDTMRDNALITVSGNLLRLTPTGVTTMQRLAVVTH